MRIGIFFGGNSREREVSFAGGRTVYDNLDKSLFEAIPIFVDSFNNLILLDWKYIYKGSIRDFYPPVSALKGNKHNIQIYAENVKQAHENNGKQLVKQIGKQINVDELKNLIDFAFLALHGSNGEDGRLQGMLEWNSIPYSGSGILPSALGMNKRFQKNLMSAAGMNVPEYYSFSRNDLGNLTKIYPDVKSKVGFPFVIKPANQGSSIGVSVISADDFNKFETAVKKAFFILEIEKSEWVSKSQLEKTQLIQKLTDVKESIGLPALIDGEIIYHPDELWTLFDKNFKTKKSITIESIYGETDCLIESFIDGREFSCIVIRHEDGTAVALPPTEIVKGKEVYDYRSKYLPGLSRKITPIDLAENKIDEIRKECQKLFDFFGFHVYARIDGFINKKGKIFLNDPNTTSGMMPSSFFFHQAAEIGLNPSQFLTYIIRTSLAERMRSLTDQFETKRILDLLDKKLAARNKNIAEKKRVAVLMGGYSTERHISVESGRNVFEKLASSTKYKPFTVFVTGDAKHHELYLLPINMMLKDNADDIKEKIFHFSRSKVLDKIVEECKDIIQKYSDKDAVFVPRKISYKELAKSSDCVFIALHGRPGEDGQIQKELNKFKVPFNGSGVASSQLTINKFETNEILAKYGIKVAEHLLIDKTDWNKKNKSVLEKIEKISYPLIAKPVDDGCSSAVKKIKNRTDLLNYAEGVFRKSEEIPATLAAKLGLKSKEEFPMKGNFLIEKFVDKGKAMHFLEVTGGMLTHYKKGKKTFEMFEPSEALAESEILSLEEKFLAGQGQNITPARFSKNSVSQKIISKKVQDELKKVAKILGIEGYCRIDAFVRIFPKNEVEVIIIELNSLPGMTPATAIFHQCAINGYKPFEFIDKILEFGGKNILAVK